MVRSVLKPESGFAGGACTPLLTSSPAAHASKLGEFEDHGVVPEFRDVHGRVAREARIAELVSAVQLVAAIAEAGDANWAVVRLGKWLA